MKSLKIQMIPLKEINGKQIPVNIVLVKTGDIKSVGLTSKAAIDLIAKNINGPTAINIFDEEAVTTTSDGVMVQGAIVTMASVDANIVNPDFGILEMAEIPYSDEIIELEPHLIQWKKRYSGRKLFRGPDPAKKIIPVHNVTITGRTANNNSGTEMMNIVTMNEILFPILGQITCLHGGEVVVGYIGGVISVGIGMTVAEQYGRIFPTRQFKAGQTAHGSGIYAQTLKETIPCIVGGKKILAEHILNAFDDGCRPAIELGCSPAVLALAKAYGIKIDVDRIEESAFEELESVGCTKDWILSESEVLSREEIIGSAYNIIPGVGEPEIMDSRSFVETIDIPLE